MKIWFDIGHPAQYNFYKNAIINLANDNIVFVTAIDRGKLLVILSKELYGIKGCEVIKVGKYTGTKLSVIFRSNILRFFQLCLFFFKNKPDISVGNGFLHGFVSLIFRKPRLMFGDDIERKLDVWLKKLSATEMYYANVIRKGENIKTFNALKEWAYLSPKYFIPDDNVLVEYSLQKKKYIFVREVITGSLNYQRQQANLIASIANSLPENIYIVLSLEDKSTIDQYPKDWILLKEPVKSIHSIIYNSLILISSGDSMAREASILGVPSIYCGIRDMAANQLMIEKKILFHKKIGEVTEMVNLIISDNQNIPEQSKIRKQLEIEWVDITSFIIEKILAYKHLK